MRLPFCCRRAGKGKSEEVKGPGVFVPEPEGRNGFRSPVLRRIDGRQGNGHLRDYWCSEPIPVLVNNNRY